VGDKELEITFDQFMISPKKYNIDPSSLTAYLKGFADLSVLSI
jgi:hypothetical protein